MQHYCGAKETVDYLSIHCDFAETVCMVNSSVERILAIPLPVRESRNNPATLNQEEPLESTTHVLARGSVFQAVCERSRMLCS